MKHIYLIWDENDRVVATLTSRKKVIDELRYWLEERDGDNLEIENLPENWDGTYHVLHLTNRKTGDFLTFTIGRDLVNNASSLVSMKARAEALGLPKFKMGDRVNCKDDVSRNLKGTICALPTDPKTDSYLVDTDEGKGAFAETELTLI